MGLNFPNPVRSFDAGRSCVSFWGADAAIEVAFQIELDALHKLGARTGDGEAQVLAVFDEHHDAILQIAAGAYARNRSRYHRLTASDVPPQR